MTYIKSIVLFIVCFGAALGFVLSCISKVAPTPKEVQYITVADTAKIVELENILQLTRDSLNAYKNDTSMHETEFILRYKLERIRYYNDCAAKGNNIKFLRGWINRVLNE